MSDMELSQRGKILVLVPISLIAGGFLFQEPFVVLIGVSVLSSFIYSRFYLKKYFPTVSLNNRVPDGIKNVDKSFTVEQKLTCDSMLIGKLRTSFSEDFEVEEDDSEVLVIDNQTKLNHKVTPKRRGYLKLGGAEVTLYDPMKFFKKKRTFPSDKEVIIQSSIETIRRAKSFAKRSHEEELIEDLKQFTSTSSELENIREYQPGDKLRDIHWKSLSKFQKHMTKVYEKMTQLDCHILLDNGPSMRRYVPDGARKQEHAIYVALELLKKFQLAGHDIGLTAFDHKKVLINHTPDHRKGTFKRLFNEMAELPGPIRSSGYDVRRYDVSISLEGLKKAEKNFAEKVGVFLSSSSKSELGGMIDTVRRLRKSSNKSSILILLTDLETRPNMTIKSIEKLRAMDHEVWVVVLFSPWYDMVDIDEEKLELAYQDYENLEDMLQKIEKAGAHVFELFPKKEGLKILKEKWGKT